MKYVRVNFTISETLLQEVDLYIKDHAMTRSGLIQLLLTQYLNDQKAANNDNEV